MKALKSRLYQIEELDKRSARWSTRFTNAGDAGWSSKSGPYVLQPYQMVKICAPAMRRQTRKVCSTVIWMRLWVRHWPWMSAAKADTDAADDGFRAVTPSARRYFLDQRQPTRLTRLAWRRMYKVGGRYVRKLHQ
jgi:hypothetical protein